MSEKPTLAIIGLGISGMGCAHFLQHDYDLTLFEANDYVGGHTNTVTVQEKDRDVPIDTGFMVYNEDTYPNLTKLFRELEISTMETSMSFSVNHRIDKLQYNGGKLNEIFGQRKSIFNLRYWRMLLKITKFNKDALEDLEDSKVFSLSLRDYVDHRGYGEDFLNWYLIPMASAVWSSPPEEIEHFPAITLLRFWKNHGFLAVNTRKQWRTVIGGSKTYVKKLTEPFQDLIKINEAVTSVQRAHNEVTIHTENGSYIFDHVILATHADDSLCLLEEPSETEQDVLQHFHYQPNLAVLHTDKSIMPSCRPCWASWNYDISKNSDGQLVSSTHYWMNSLQKVSENENYFVTINPRTEIQGVLKTINYHHPLFNLAAIEAQERIPELNQKGIETTNTYFVGAWQRYGFHEDGLLSAVNLCSKLLGRDVWS